MYKLRNKVQRPVTLLNGPLTHQYQYNLQILYSYIVPQNVIFLSYLLRAIKFLPFKPPSLHISLINDSICLLTTAYSISIYCQPLYTFRQLSKTNIIQKTQSLQMNYLKHLLQSHTEQPSKSDNSPQQSGQFQVIDQDDVVEQQQKQKNNHLRKSSVSLNQPDRKSNKNEVHSSGDLTFLPELENQEASNAQLQKLNERLSKEYTIIEIDDTQFDHKDESCNGSASTIKIEEYYMIVSTEELQKKFTSKEQWDHFFCKIKCFHQEIVASINTSSNTGVSKQQNQRKRHKISLNLKQLNSIIQIKPEQTELRQEYWNKIAVSPVNIRFKYTQLSNKKDPQKLQKNVDKIMSSLAPAIMFQIVQRKYKQIQNVQKQLENWKEYIVKVLTLYGANDKQIGYSKGLQYIAMGILVAKPFQHQERVATGSHSQNGSIQKLQVQQSFMTINQTAQLASPCISSGSSTYQSLQIHFKYLLFTRQLRNMYFPGTPKLYQQIQLLCQLMRSQVSSLFLKLQELKVDFIKVFINYYKTFLMYKVKNPQVIRKIMELLIVYGIDVVRVLLTRIMNRNELKILEMMGQQEIHLLRYLAEDLIEDYFGNGDTQQTIHKFKQLFILDISK